MVKKPHFRKNEEETGVVEVDGVKIDAASAEIVYVDPDKDIQVVLSNDPEGEGVVCAVMTTSAEDLEDNEVLGSAVAEPEGEGEGAGAGEGDAEEARKAEARKRFRERFAARREAKKAEEAKKAAEAKAEARKKAADEARAKFRAHMNKAK